jgi:hypothetical protein
LFGKGTLADSTADIGDENGLGLTSDSSGQTEITKGNWISLDLSNLIGYSNVKFSMNSTTNGEAWQACYSNSATSFGSTGCVTGTDELDYAYDGDVGHSIASPTLAHPFLNFTATGESDNVLLHTLSADHVTTTAVPEPASLFLLGTGLVGISRRWRKRAN